MRLSPEFALTDALETVPALAGKVSVMQPKKSTSAPLAFYIPQHDSVEKDLDGETGLQHFTALVHLVAPKHRQLQLIARLAAQAVEDMRGSLYRTPEEDPEEGPKGVILVENTEMEQSSPDLYDTDPRLFRRVYTVRIDYQTEEVYDEEGTGP